MLKNRYYYINLNDGKETIFLMRVKKDFYTEGIIINKDKVLQGYFNFYHYIQLNILDNSDLKSTIDNHGGIIGSLEQGLSYAGLDEEFIAYALSDKIPAILVEIDDQELIKKIDFLIRSRIKKLNSNNKKIYDFFHQRRMDHYKEMKFEAISPIHMQNATEYILIDDPKIDFTRDDLSEIEEYLKSLNQSKKKIKGRDENGKKIRKRRNSK